MLCSAHSHSYAALAQLLLWYLALQFLWVFFPKTPALHLKDLGLGLVLNSATWSVYFSRWDFGDDVQETYQFKPPYNKSFLVPDPSVHEVVIEHNVTHVYEHPGKLGLVLCGRRDSDVFVGGVTRCLQIKWLARS